MIRSTKHQQVADKVSSSVTRAVIKATPVVDPMEPQPDCFFTILWEKRIPTAGNRERQMFDTMHREFWEDYRNERNKWR